MKRGIGSLPMEEHDALGLTMRHRAFIVLMLPTSCPQQVLSPASQDNVMVGDLLSLGFQWKTQHFHSLGRRGWNRHLREQVNLSLQLKQTSLCSHQICTRASAEGYRTEAVVSGKWNLLQCGKGKEEHGPSSSQRCQACQNPGASRPWSTEGGKKGPAVLIFTDHLPLSGPCSLQKNYFADIIRKYT